MAKIGHFSGKLYTRWGNRDPKRNTESRPEIQDEAYISIPQADARRLDIFMSNHPTANTKYEAVDAEGQFIGTLKAEGCTKKDAPCAKQFAVSGNLKGLKVFIEENGLKDKDKIDIKIIDSNKLILTPIP